jgi:parallel beta-helix repeat protein
MLRKAMILALMAGSGALFALPASPAAAATFNPVADSYTDAANAAVNYGNRAYVRADASPVLRTYLRFNVTGFVAGSTSSLRLFAESSGSAGISVFRVADTTWGENTITSANAPALGALVATAPRFSAGTWVTVNVTSAVTANGLVSLAVTTTGTTAVKFSSKETATAANRPQLVNPAGTGPSPYDITKLATPPNTYQARSAVAPNTTFTGTLKSVVERAVSDLGSAGGQIRFAAGTFDLGAEFFNLDGIANVDFVGATTATTIIQNNSSAAADTEPFNFSGVNRVKIRNMTIAARGPLRTTSDAIDFDNGSDNLVENVAVTAARGRAIIFDGKNTGFVSLRNTIRGCTIGLATGAPTILSDGIELLGSSEAVIENCTINNVAGHGIQVTKSSTTAGQPNKQSNNNIIRNNVIDNSGQDGINVNSSNGNQMLNNTVRNSANITQSRDGIRIGAADNIACNANRVAGNTSTDNQTTKTQKYGVHIQSPLCNATQVALNNNLAGNLTADLKDSGTGTTRPAT